MKKPTTKRICLGMAQHFIAAIVMVITAGILFNSYVAVESMQGTQIYMVNSFGSGQIFEDSELFRNIFETAVSDITRLVVIKGQVETDGVFDPSKKIDVTEYANRKGNGNDCPITVVYELDDLIKWGKNGIQYTNRAMSMSDFVNYYGAVNDPANFALNEDGQLYFKGFAKSLDEINWEDEDDAAFRTEEEAFLTEEDEQKAILQALQSYTEEQLEDMAFSYIITEVPQGINMNREDDGTLTVYFTAINCRYATADGEKQLLACADNWVDYMSLQNNLADTITSLTNHYQQYQDCNALYQEGKSNLKYAVRMMTEDGLRTYTNVSELSDAKDSDITEFFAEYRRYFIYYPDSLELSGNTSLTEDDIYNYMKEYEYAYPETTHIWIGVDTAYPIVGDAFYNANTIFRRIVPHVEMIMGAIILLSLGWLAIGLYLTITAGVMYDEDGEQEKYLNGIDHIWTELVILFGIAFVYAGKIGFDMLTDIADQVYITHPEMRGIISETGLYRYGAFALYGVLVSMSFSLFWYSLVRRIRNGNLWKDSLIHWILWSVQRGIGFVLTHSNTAISILIPYNFFLMVNLVGIFSVYMLRDHTVSVLVVMMALVVFDGIIGVLLFKNGAERLDIVEGIKRIRDGEVDYKLDTENLHSANKEMADAVNNIGEGIRKAVKTSLKDEQMKTDLITNVSHDLKTPLTSIISYVDLLKRLKIEEEPAKSYINILDGKSQRLKQLTDDLVEASKISSGNIELAREPLNLTELLNQSLGEFSEKLEDRQLQVVFEGNDIPAHIYADSRRMWRIIENLFNNICKYALEGTRVYIDLIVKDGEVEVSIKNISERQMNIRADELTERFIRGDDSRTTEGSGLGLSIAKSLTEVQGGSFVIYLDGDLFKVVIAFPEFVEETEKTEETEGAEESVKENVKVDAEKNRKRSTKKFTKKNRKNITKENVGLKTKENAEEVLENKSK